MGIKFDKCLKNGGKVRTKTLPDNKYMRICILGGKTFAGEVKTRKHPKKAKRPKSPKKK